MRYLWRFVWDSSELFHVPLGRFAPFVFSKMIGRTGKRVG